MIKNKKGFSLAEVLICVGIVSIIATAGFSIANRSIDRAYDLYVYTGYKALSDAFMQANEDNMRLSWLTNNNNKEAFGEYIKTALSGKDVNTTLTDSHVFYFTTPNNISYEMLASGGTGTVQTRFTIKMRVPARKNKNGSYRTVYMYYAESNERYDMLIPFSGDASDPTCITNIQDRVDLLPFYVDDGTTGRIIKGQESNYTKRQYYSFKEAICIVYGYNATDSYMGFTCDNDLPRESGILKVANPRKIF